MTILAFDYGEARIGVAIKKADELGPQPLQTLQNNQQLNDSLKALIDEFGADLLIVGRPRNLDGESTTQTKSAEQFATMLQDTYKKEVKLQDEALTSEEAEIRIPASIPESQRRQVIDQYAAVIILEDYLREA